MIYKCPQLSCVVAYQQYVPTQWCDHPSTVDVYMWHSQFECFSAIVDRRLGSRSMSIYGGKYSCLACDMIFSSLIFQLACAVSFVYIYST